MSYVPVNQPFQIPQTAVTEYTCVHLDFRIYVSCESRAA